MSQPPGPPPPPPGPPSGPPPGWGPPGGQQPPPQGQPGHPGQQAMGTLVVTLQGSALTSNMISPSVRLNGYPVPTSYGDNRLPVTAGPIHVDVEAQWMKTYGQAAIDVDVPAGGTVQVFYAGPWHQFTTGSIGYEKQKRKGTGFLIGLVLVLLLVIVGIPLIGILG